MTPAGEFPPALIGNPSIANSSNATSKFQQFNQRIGLWNWWGGSQTHIEPIGASEIVAKEDHGCREKDKSPPGHFPSSRSSSSVSSSESPNRGAVVSAEIRQSPESVALFTNQLRAPRFSASTLFAAILIAFLVGSLLRSLLSPADFIYVVTDLKDVPGYSAEGAGGLADGPHGGSGRLEPGWREIKRLLEVKYLVGGWDFQVAVVRRH